MIHSRIQVDPAAKVSVRPGPDGTVDLVVLDPAGDASAVVNLLPAHLAEIMAFVAEMWPDQLAAIVTKVNDPEL